MVRRRKSGKEICGVYIQSWEKRNQTPSTIRALICWFALHVSADNMRQFKIQKKTCSKVWFSIFFLFVSFACVSVTHHPRYLAPTCPFSLFVSHLIIIQFRPFTRYLYADCIHIHSNNDAARNVIIVSILEMNATRAYPFEIIFMSSDSLSGTRISPDPIGNAFSVLFFGVSFMLPATHERR